MSVEFAKNNITNHRTALKGKDDTKDDQMLSVTRSKTIQPFSAHEEPALMAQKVQRNLSNANVLSPSVLSSVALSSTNGVSVNSKYAQPPPQLQQANRPNKQSGSSNEKPILPSLVRSVSLSHDVLQQQFRRSNTVDDLQPGFNGISQNDVLDNSSQQQQEQEELRQANYNEQVKLQQQQQQQHEASMNPFGSLNMSPFPMNSLQTPAFPTNTNANFSGLNLNNYNNNNNNNNNPYNTSNQFNPTQSVVSQLFTPNFGPYGNSAGPSLPQLGQYNLNAFNGFNGMPQTPLTGGMNPFGSYGSYGNNINNNGNTFGQYGNYLLSPSANPFSGFTPVLPPLTPHVGSNLNSLSLNALNSNVTNNNSQFSINQTNMEYFSNDTNNDNGNSYSSFNGLQRLPSHSSNINSNNNNNSNNQSTILANTLYPNDSTGFRNTSIEKSRAEVFLEELRLKLKTSPNTPPTVLSNNISHKSSIAGTNTFCSKNIYLESGITFTLDDVLGYSYDFSRDQLGSRFLQFQLESEEVSQELKDQLFAELIGYIHVLCKDVFGNYVVQKLLDLHVGTKEQHNYIVNNAIKNHMCELATHMYGCRVVQKLVEQIFGYTSHLYSINSTANSESLNSDKNIEGNGESENCYEVEAQDKLLDELRSDVLSLVTDQNGNHVIQKCIEQISPISRLDFFFKAFKDNYVHMSKHPYGCRVVQRVLEYAEITEKAKVLKEVLGSGDAFLAEMIQDQYANYVVQHVIEHNLPFSIELNLKSSQVGQNLKLDDLAAIEEMKENRKKLFKLVGNNVLSFSQHKFGSNVVESCLKFGNENERVELIDEMLKGNSLIMMMKDPYANYVVQKLIDKANSKQVSQVTFLVGQNETTLRRLTYGKHILNKIKSMQS